MKACRSASPGHVFMTGIAPPGLSAHVSVPITGTACSGDEAGLCTCCAVACQPAAGRPPAHPVAVADQEHYPAERGQSGTHPPARTDRALVARRVLVIA